MTEQTSSATPLKDVYAGWERFNTLLVTMIAPLTPEQLTIRTAQHQREVVKIVGHIISARAWWFHGRLGEGDAKWEQYYTWDEDDGPALNAASKRPGGSSPKAWRTGPLTTSAARSPRLTTACAPANGLSGTSSNTICSTAAKSVSPLARLAPPASTCSATSTRAWLRTLTTGEPQPPRYVRLAP